MSQTVESRTNAAEYTVSELSGALKRTVEDAFGNVRVRGEISGYRGPHSSGHAYFCLKDDRAKIEAVVWRTTMVRLKFKPEEGMEVVASGKLGTYPSKSSYQIVIDSLEPAGAGALMALLEERKKRLAAEGLFDPSRKRRLPYMPAVIGVVTSPTGSVIRDIIHRIKDRFPLRVLVWPVRVQGETCGAEVTAAIEGFNAMPAGGGVPRPDAIIVARGGGSLEDLWGFNDETLARAVAASGIPTISAIGHETDWTLIDYAADCRAPTPTGAAEIAVPVRAELEARLAGLASRLRACASRGLDRRRAGLRAAGRALPSGDQVLALPRRGLDEAAARFERALEISTERRRARLSKLRLTPATLSRRIADFRGRAERDMSRGRAALRALIRDRRGTLARADGQLPKCASASLRHRRQALAVAARRVSIEPVTRLQKRSTQRLAAVLRRGEQAMSVVLQRSRARLGQAERLLATLGTSDKAILDRGYALVVDASGNLVRRAAEVVPGAELSLRFADGVARATGGAAASKGPQRGSGKPKQPALQGSLF